MQNFEFYAPTRMIFGKDTHKQVGKLVKEYGFKKVYDVDASSTISSHCGPGTLGILFINKEPETDANNA